MGCIYSPRIGQRVAGRELTKTEPCLERCGDTRTTHDGQLNPFACGTIDTDSNAASHSKSTMDGRAAAAGETLSCAFDSPTSKAQDERQKVSQTLTTELSGCLQSCLSRSASFHLPLSTAGSADLRNDARKQDADTTSHETPQTFDINHEAHPSSNVWSFEFKVDFNLDKSLEAMVLASHHDTHPAANGLDAAAADQALVRPSLPGFAASYPPPANAHHRQRPSVRPVF